MFAYLRKHGPQNVVVYNYSVVPFSLLSELRSCVKVEVAVLCFPSLIIRTVSVDVKQH